MTTSDPALALENDAVEPLEVASQTDFATDGVDAVDGGMDAAVSSAPTETDRWKQRLEEVGFKDVTDLDSSVDRVAQAYAQQRQQNESMAEQLREYKRMLQYQQQYGQQQYQPPAPTQAAPATSTDSVDALTTGWIEIPSHIIDQYRVAKQEPDGSISYELSPLAPPEVRQQVEQARHQRATWETTLSDPRKLMTAVDRRIQEAVDKQLGNTLSQREHEQENTRAAQEFFQQNDWVFERDPASGQPAVDPVTGNPVYSREGRQFLSLYKQTAEDGLQSVTQRIRYATAMFNATRVATAAAPVDSRQQAAVVADQKKREMLGRTRTPSPVTQVNGVSPVGNGAIVGQSQLSHGQNLVARLKEEGLLAG